jgi:hypothetical protein
MSLEATVAEVSSKARAAGAAVDGDSNVVRANAAIVASTTLRPVEEINPLRINISIPSMIAVISKLTEGWLTQIDQGQNIFFCADFFCYSALR